MASTTAIRGVNPLNAEHMSANLCFPVRIENHGIR